MLGTKRTIRVAFGGQRLGFAIKLKDRAILWQDNDNETANTSAFYVFWKLPAIFFLFSTENLDTSETQTT